MAYDRHLRGILPGYLIFQEMDPVDRSVYEVVEDGLILHIGELQRTAV